MATSAQVRFTDSCCVRSHYRLVINGIINGPLVNINWKMSYDSTNTTRLTFTLLYVIEVMLFDFFIDLFCGLYLQAGKRLMLILRLIILTDIR